MLEKRARVFSRDFKLKAVERLESGESPTALGRELGVRPTLLHQWWSHWRRGGASALRRPGRPRGREAAALADMPSEMSAERKIAELERKVGEQALLIDFFKGALQRIEASRQASGLPGATASSRRSKR